jgi:putative oxidoreductase
MAVAAYHHILTSGFNIYVLELVVLYLGGSVSLLLLGPGRISFDAGLARELLDESSDAGDPTVQDNPSEMRLNPIPVQVSSN